jgi:polyvinyl alcohol dehydrogenase (cytochrome)
MRFLILSLLLLTGLLAACAGTATAPEETHPPRATEAEPGWTMLGFDVGSSFHNASEDTISVENVAGLTEAWRTEAIVQGMAAVSDGVVYVLSNDSLSARDAATGDVIWENESIGGTSTPTLRDGVVYANARNSVVHAVDAATGEQLWESVVDPHQFASGFSSPVVAGDLVIVGSSSGEEAIATKNATFRGGVVAFDRATGTEVWRHYTVEPPENGVSVWSSVSVDEDAGAVFATTGNNYTEQAGDTSDSIFALDGETGELLWLTQLTEGDLFTIRNAQSADSDFGTNPILFEADGRKLLGAGQKSGMFWVLDRETGEVVWSREVSGGSALIGGVFNNGAYDGERIIVAGNNGESDGPGSEPASGESEVGLGTDYATSVLMAMDPADGTVLWERQLAAWAWAPITIANGVGYVSTESTLQAFDVETGEKLFTFQTEGTVTSGAAVADGMVYFGSGLVYFATTPASTFYALTLP